MLVTTHTIIAQAIAIKTGNPWIYAPAAMANHFILDTLPHFGPPKNFTKRQVKKFYDIAVPLDAIAGIILFVFVASLNKFNPYLLFLICFLAGWPDLIGFYRNKISKDSFPRFYKFHHRIQQFESLWGIIFEVPIIILCIYLIFTR